jgi:phosphoribosylanthranilate isomerase
MSAAEAGNRLAARVRVETPVHSTPKPYAPVIKICGIKTFADGLAALEAGADMLGFNFYEKSPRYLEPSKCAILLSKLRSTGILFLSIGVFVDLPGAMVREIIEKTGIELAQLSGNERADDFEDLRGRAFKAYRPTSAESLDKEIRLFPPRDESPSFLLDAFVPGKFGGTGRRVDLDIARKAFAYGDFLLAGGLNPENVGKIVGYLKPWGLDAASGVESSPGKKDKELMRRFIHGAKSAIAQGIERNCT